MVIQKDIDWQTVQLISCQLEAGKPIYRQIEALQMELDGQYIKLSYLFLHNNVFERMVDELSRIPTWTHLTQAPCIEGLDTLNLPRGAVSVKKTPAWSHVTAHRGFEPVFIMIYDPIEWSLEPEYAEIDEAS